MCIILFSYLQHPRYPLIVAANRDEYYIRPTAQAAFWSDHPNVLAGRDLEQMGTWMGITRTGRFAALTNFRSPLQNDKNKRSRGELVSHFLQGKDRPFDYLERIQKESDQYNGFNLLLGNSEELFYYSSTSTRIEKVLPGVYGLSNAELNTPWIKVKKGADRLRQEVLQSEIDEERLFAILTDVEAAADELLPHTGVGIEWERVLSPVFIKSEGYGTRSSTLLTMDMNKHVTYRERTYKGNEQLYSEVYFSFGIQE